MIKVAEQLNFNV